MQNQGTSVRVYENMYGHPMASNKQNATTFMCSHQASRRKTQHPATKMSVAVMKDIK